MPNSSTTMFSAIDRREFKNKDGVGILKNSPYTVFGRATICLKPLNCFCRGDPRPSRNMILVCLDCFGARGETRTLTPVKAGDFESPASTIPPLGPPTAYLAKPVRPVQRIFWFWRVFVSFLKVMCASGRNRVSIRITQGKEVDPFIYSCAKRRKLFGTG